jgi:OOP family OmpA-OmpF porin
MERRLLMLLATNIQLACKEMTMRRIHVWASLTALVIAQAAAADDSGFYLGAGVGLAQTGNTSRLGVADLPLLTGKTHDDDTTWGVAAGYRINQNIAIEVGYVDLGEITSEVTDATGATDARAASGFSADGVTLALIGTFPLGNWEPYLKAGLLSSNTVLEFAGSAAGGNFGARITNEDEDALYGIGVSYAVSESLRIYLDLTYLMEVGESDTGRSDYLNPSAGAIWRF